MRIALVWLMILAFAGIGLLDILDGRFNTGVASALLAVVNYLFLTA